MLRGRQDIPDVSAMPQGRNRAVGLVFKDDSQLLLVHRKKQGRDYWVFPGGGLEKNESLPEAVAREILEESSVEIEVGDLLYSHPNLDGGCSYYFVCKWIAQEPRIDPDSEEAQRMSEQNQYAPQWVDPSRLGELDLHPREIRDRLIKDLAANSKQ